MGEGLLRLELGLTCLPGPCENWVRLSRGQGTLMVRGSEDSEAQ